MEWDKNRLVLSKSVKILLNLGRISISAFSSLAHRSEALTISGSFALNGACAHILAIGHAWDRDLVIVSNEHE